MSNDPFPNPDRLDPGHAPRSGPARVATLRDMAYFAGEAFGWDEASDTRLESAARLHAARRSFIWTLSCIALLLVAYAYAHVSAG